MIKYATLGTAALVLAGCGSSGLLPNASSVEQGRLASIDTRPVRSMTANDICATLVSSAVDIIADAAGSTVVLRRAIDGPVYSVAVDQWAREGRQSRAQTLVDAKVSCGRAANPKLRADQWQGLYRVARPEDYRGLRQVRGFLS